MPPSHGSTVIPTFRYQDADAALAWLQDVFGFEEKLAVRGPENILLHAQLVRGTGMVMIGQARDGDYDRALGELSGEKLAAGGVSVTVPDIETFYESVRSKNADIVSPLKKEVQGKGFLCRDPEGYFWYFGEYDPWAS